MDTLNDTVQQMEFKQTDDEKYQEKIIALTAMNNEKTMEIEKLKTKIAHYEGKIIYSSHYTLCQLCLLADLQLKQKEIDLLKATLNEGDFIKHAWH